MILSNLSFRQLSCRIAGSDLLADFCGVRRLLGVIGKLTVCGYLYTVVIDFRPTQTDVKIYS